MSETSSSTPSGPPTVPPHVPHPHSEAATAALIENSNEAMLLADDRGFITYANAACSGLLGLPPDQLVGRSWFDLCQPEDLPATRDAFARCVETPGMTVTCDVDVRHPIGNFRSLAIRLLQVPRTDAILAYFADVSSSARDIGESYRALFESALTGLGVADLEGNLLAFNDAILRPGGYTHEDMLRLGNVSRLYASEADRQRVLRIAKEKGVVWREEVQFVRKDGSPYDTLLTLTPVRFRGHRCWYATVEDVTDQRRVEAERQELEVKLWQAQKMQAVGNMTAGIAHDFNNVLAVILMNADLIASDLGLEAKASRSDLAELRAAAERGSEMINKLLGFSRSASLRVESTNVADVVNELHPTLRRLIPEDILLEMSLAEHSTARCDRGAVAEMLMNLATNARDAMPDGGTLRLAIGPAVMTSDAPERPGWMTPGEFVRLSMSDTGIGMDEATRARVLEPFFTTKAPGAGTGLGLSMVYGLAKQQGGFIDVLSERGHGTTVHLYFPAAS